MAKLKSFEDLKQYALEYLGAPVIKIEVADSQVEARINDAIEFFMERHYDGVEELAFACTITEADALSQYIIMPENMQAVINITSVNGATAGIGGISVPGLGIVGNIPGQYCMYNNVSSAGHLTSYYINKSNLALMQDLTRPNVTYEYTPATHGLTMPGTQLVEGDVYMIHGYVTVDPEDYVDVYNERFLKLYSAALIKRQWANNIKKYGGVQLAGGITMNGQRMYDEAIAEIKDLEDDFEERYEFPSSLLVG